MPYLIVPRPPTAAMVAAAHDETQYVTDIRDPLPVSLAAANAAGAVALADVPGLRERLRSALWRHDMYLTHDDESRYSWTANCECGWQSGHGKESEAKANHWRHIADVAVNEMSALLAGAAPAQETP